MTMQPIVDLHCDLPSYLSSVKGAGVFNGSEMGATVPHLQAGNVKLQVMAIYTDTRPGSVTLGKEQVSLYSRLPLLSRGFFGQSPSLDLSLQMLLDEKCLTLAAIENASGFCEEGEPLDAGLARLSEIVSAAGPLAYVIITHHYENRFGGGNYTEVGLKPDGEVLLDFLDGKSIPVDLSHTSDKLAYGILDYIDKKQLRVPVLASHSNFRNVHGHVRNLPDELVKELVARGGLVGINFLRNYIHDTDPSALYRHVEYGEKLGIAHGMAFGADFFYALNHPDPSRYPIYFPGQDDASCYPTILQDLLNRGLSEAFCQGISWKNALNYYTQLTESEKAGQLY